MSLPRFAGWGGLGGFLFSLVFLTVTGLGLDLLPLLGAIFALSGAGCAAGSLALARMADDGALLEDGSRVDEVGLSDEERRDLLGERD